MQTIAAISTPVGAGAIGIVRISGDDALKVAAKIFRTSKLKDLKDAVPNMMYYGTVTAGEVSDRCLGVYFKAPKTYTGENIFELHCHGGVRLVNEILKGCIEAGARAADKGEFTKRAFLNGKLALSDAEAVISMINAESEAQLKASYRSMTGKLSEEIYALEEKLLDAIATMEAALDYPEEMEEESRRVAKDTVNALCKELEKLIATAKTGSYVKQGIDVAIVGIANVGKSSTLNALTGKDRAIVTEIAGTTRDSLEERIEVNGVIINLIDTAGIRETDDKVEKLGVDRSRAIAKNSDLVLFITEAGRELTGEEKEILISVDGSKVLYVFNKDDKPHAKDDREGIFVSAKTGEGIERLKKEIVDRVIGGEIDFSGNIVTDSRHYDALKRAYFSLTQAKEGFDEEPAECLLVDMRDAYSALGEITGNTADESIVNAIFSKFCLGK
ncbi:MAG TPA: tRNA uridine-5-carboxymethylaminomethyl(34) synthesis GTPase MnmE [Candidatus Ornithoclostridium faecavium]|nr:tRNA uridine-5-carboxymethylaminomethyl(34) synthesis GTPase MnmE [Candidatus Ornithoclostridium faecavium]